MILASTLHLPKMPDHPPPYRCALCKRLYGTALIEGYCPACVTHLIQEAKLSLSWLYIQLNARRERFKKIKAQAKEGK